MIYTIKHLMKWNVECEIGGEWVPCRPVTYMALTLRERFRAAWMVFTGKADAVVWPGGQ